jgi:hypothetical protein
MNVSPYVYIVSNFYLLIFSCYLCTVRQVTDVLVVGSDICDEPGKFWNDPDWVEVMRKKPTHIVDATGLSLFYKKNLCRLINSKLGEKVLDVDQVNVESWVKRCIITLSYGSRKSIEV